MSRTTSEKKKLPRLVRIPLAIVRVLLALCLIMSFLATAVVLDLQTLTGRDAIAQLTDELLCTPTVSHIRLSQEPGAASNPLTDLIFDYVKDQFDDLIISKEEFSAFIEESTLPEFLADKSVSYVEDFINGTENTTITPEEIGALIDENKDLIEKTFDVTIDDQAKQKVMDFVEENEVSSFVHEKVFDQLENTNLGVGDYTVGNVLDSVRMLFSPSTLFILFAVDALLTAGLFFASLMHLGTTLLYAGIPALLVGATLTVPTVFAQDLLPQLLPPALVEPIFQLTGLVSPIHLAFLLAGAAAAVAGIILKCLFRSRL